MFYDLFSLSDRLESYEEIISNGMKEASEKLTIIDSQDILSALLHLQVQVYYFPKEKEK